MAGTAFALVILSGVLHATWNLFAKRSFDKTVFLWLCQLAAILLFLPFFVVEVSQLEALSGNGWVLLAASMILHGAYVVLLAKAYTVGDLSQVYPVIRGASPLLVPVIAVALLGESLSAVGWMAIALILAGIFMTGGLKLKGYFAANRRPLTLALLVGGLIASYTVVDKAALAHLPAVTLNQASNVGNFLFLSFMVRKPDVVRKEWRLNWRTILLGGLMAPGGYILFLLAVDMMPVSRLAPMREIGTVIGTLLGIFILKEAHGKLRLAASALITAGVVLLAMYGG